MCSSYWRRVVLDEFIKLICKYMFVKRNAPVTGQQGEGERGSILFVLACGAMVTIKPHPNQLGLQRLVELVLAALFRQEH